MKIACIVGTRPNFIKAIPVFEALKKKFPNTELIHTGQHYDELLSKFILEELGAKEPDHFFKDPSFPTKSFSEQYGSIMGFLDELIQKNSYDWFFVFGDVTSTLIAAQIAKYKHKSVAHVEAGLRSFDLKMPEELNRMMVDKISDLHFVTEESGVENLVREGMDQNKIKLVGNTMIDTLFRFEKKIRDESLVKYEKYSYYVLTLHRPSNVDNLKTLEKNIHAVISAAGDTKIIFPVHPRTRKNLEKLPNLSKDLILVDPLPYTSFLNLVNFSKAVLTDSGGIQEEASVLNVPCLTLRENTERPITLKFGTNRLISFDSLSFHLGNIESIENREINPSIPFWDGKAAERIVLEFSKRVK